jgi:2-oxoglutarate ferredoxin oxidoreductase subunit delta
MKAFIKIDQERCKGCALCMEFCPKKAICISGKLNPKGYFVAALEENAEAGSGCTGCATCAIMCPEVAIEVYKN